MAINHILAVFLGAGEWAVYTTVRPTPADPAYQALNDQITLADEENRWRWLQYCINNHSLAISACNSSISVFRASYSCTFRCKNCTEILVLTSMPREVSM